LETTCPLAENTHIPTPVTRHSTPAAAPPGASSTIDDDLLDSSLRYLDECLERRRKRNTDPAPIETPSTTPLPRPPTAHPLHGHPLIGQVAALAQRDQAQRTDAPNTTASASLKTFAVNDEWQERERL
jgi:hypothetical protein